MLVQVCFVAFCEGFGAQTRRVVLMIPLRPAASRLMGLWLPKWLVCFLLFCVVLCCVVVAQAVFTHSKYFFKLVYLFALPISNVLAAMLKSWSSSHRKSASPSPLGDSHKRPDLEKMNHTGVRTTQPPHSKTFIDFIVFIVAKSTVPTKKSATGPSSC